MKKAEKDKYPSPFSYDNVLCNNLNFSLFIPAEMTDEVPRQTTCIRTDLVLMVTDGTESGVDISVCTPVIAYVCLTLREIRIIQDYFSISGYTVELIFPLFFVRESTCIWFYNLVDLECMFEPIQTLFFLVCGFRQW